MTQVYKSDFIEKNQTVNQESEEESETEESMSDEDEMQSRENMDQEERKTINLDTVLLNIKVNKNDAGKSLQDLKKNQIDLDQEQISIL